MTPVKYSVSKIFCTRCRAVKFDDSSEALSFRDLFLAFRGRKV